MKATFDFDPDAQDYGPATLGVRSILKEWAAVDWFAAPNQAGQQLAFQLFEEHNRRARVHQPELFQERVALRPVTCTWKEFSGLCKRVRRLPNKWDWKYSALKQLSFRHSKSLGWNLAEQAQRLFRGRAEPNPRPGDLFIAVGDAAFWTLSPKLEVTPAVPNDYVESAQWYFSYAQMDFIECIEWQLAEKSADLSGNPFLPLVQCYKAGFYPFSFSATEVDLCAFSH